MTPDNYKKGHKRQINTNESLHEMEIYLLLAVRSFIFQSFKLPPVFSLPSL